MRWAADSIRWRAAFAAAVAIACVAHSAPTPATNAPPVRVDDMEIARKAVRDTMWDVAERHAKLAEKNRGKELEARRARLEAMAGKDDWEAVRKNAAAWNAANANDIYRYWLAYALLRLDRADEAQKTIAAAEFKEPPYVALAFRLKSRIALARGDKVQADINLKRAVENAKDPALRAELLVERARAIADSGDAGRALDVLKQGDALKAPGAAGAEARLCAAELQLAAGKAADAEKTLRELTSSAKIPSDVFSDAACLLSQELWRRDATNDAMQISTKAVERAPTPSLRRKAGFLLGFQEFAAAASRTTGVERINALVREFPDASDSRDAQRRLADSFLAAGMNDEATRAYELYFNIFPSGVLDPCVQENRGLALLGSGDIAGAAGVFALAAQKAETNAPIRARCMMRQADALAQDGRWGEAAPVYGAATKILPAASARDALFREADAHDRAGSSEDASGIYGRLAEKLDTVGIKAAMRLAARAAAAGQLPDAVARYTALLSATNLSKEIRARALVGRGRAYYHSYQFDRASADFSAAMPMAPDKADRMRFLSALCLYGERREGEAVRAASALRDSTTDAALKSDIGLWLAKYSYNSGDYEAAQKEFMLFASSCEQEDRVADAFLWIARCALARNDFSGAVSNAAKSVTSAPSAPSASAARLVQAEALMELARFDDAVLMLDEALAAPHSELLARRAEMLKADALFARGADNAARYTEALSAYRAILSNGATPPGFRIEAGFKAGRALEKLGGEKNLAEAATIYYVNVVQTFRTFREKGVWLDEAACAFFVRAAFALSDHKLARGDVQAAAQVLKEVAASGIPAAAEATKRLERLKEKRNVR